jgi:hypothetical protein
MQVDKDSTNSIIKRVEVKREQLTLNTSNTELIFKIVTGTNGAMRNASTLEQTPSLSFFDLVPLNIYKSTFEKECPHSK